MKLKLAIIFACFIVFASAQKNHSQINAKFSDGTITVQQYANNIFKVTYHSPNYYQNENITDAVVLKPVATINSALVNNNTAAISFTKEKKASFVNVIHKNGITALQFALDKGEQIFGGGERALPLNRRGYRFNLYNNPWYGYGEGADNLNFSVPFFTSSKGYGLFFDNGSKGYADIGKTEQNIFEVGFVSGEINAFIILGKDYKEILTSYQKLTGTQPLPPRWALGNLMSRFGYTSEKQVKEIAGKMKAEQIPVDGIIYDLFWFGDSIKGGVGNLDWVNKTKWPDPNKMMADFKKDHINTILITEPFIVKNTLQYNASLPYVAKDSAGKPFIISDFYFGQGGLIDIFRKDAGDWIWNIHYKKQINNGVGGWWTDLGEPERHPSAMLHNAKDVGVTRMLGADEVHNIYGHYWNKNLYEHYAKEYPNKRLFHLNRSGFAGSPRYSIFPWTGDVSRSWTGLRAQLPNLLSMSMSGVPYIHSDAGGFAGGEGDNELYVRWLQFAIFTPIFRPHGTALYEVDKAAFSFPSEAALIDTPYRNIAKSAIDLRYKFLPYNYTLAYRQAKFGEPLMRPLYYEYPKDSTAANIMDTYLWGDEILVAPVLQKAATARKIYLPEGKWFDIVGNEIYQGKQNINYKVNLTYSPIFLKEGSFLPMFETEGNTKSITKTNLSVWYIPSTKTSQYELYEDDGESKNAISSSQFVLTHFSSTGLKDKKLNINISASNGLYKNKPIQRVFQLIIPSEAKPAKVLMNGRNIPFLENSNSINLYSKTELLQYQVKPKLLLLNIAFESKPVTIEITY
jgi:oligosaccharide 4-alpha-D-glucosyltransferase